jgi:hypothetical protein
MATRQAVYETDDATVWHVVEDDRSEHWETKVGIQKTLLWETEVRAMSHVRQWEGEARHDRLHQQNPRGDYR